MTAIRVYKCDENGQVVWHYDGELLEQGDHFIQLEAIFARSDVKTEYHTFRQGDRMVEWFYDDRWYNIFEMYDVDDGRLKGWYCNITRPAQLSPEAIYADDLALDVMVYPDGRYVVLDEDEFDALPIDAQTAQNARQALQSLITLIASRQGVFAKIEPS